MGGESQPERFPMHYACYRLFPKVLRWTSPYLSDVAGDVDRETLYWSLKALYDGYQYGTCLTEIDYGTIADFQEQYWWCKKVIYHCL